MSSPMWFICESEKCNGVLHSLDTMGWDTLLINRGKCRKCQLENVLKPFNEDNWDSTKYWIWNVCYECHQWALTCSGTGCCQKCDTPPPELLRDEVLRMFSRLFGWRESDASHEVILIEGCEG